jgi:hypothetical protein
MPSGVEAASDSGTRSAGRRTRTLLAAQSISAIAIRPPGAIWIGWVLSKAVFAIFYLSVAAAPVGMLLKWQ